MGGRLLLFLLIPPLLKCETTTPAPSRYLVVDETRCMNCDLPPTLMGCGTKRNPQCREPFSMPYIGQNHKSTCARLRCPDNYDMFVNTAASGQDGNRIIDFTPRRVVLNPQTILCARHTESSYKFMIRDGHGFMRPVNDVQCRQNNFPRHSCVTDGFLKQTCTKTEKCTPINFLSDYGGNKCNEPFKLMMRFSDAVDWELMEKLSCDRELGWWRIHFPNGTWMHTRYGTIATCVAKNRVNVSAAAADRFLWSVIIRGVLIVVISLVSLLVSFNAFMCRSVVIWEGSNLQLLWRQDLFEHDLLAETRDMKQNEIVTGIKTSYKHWHEFYQQGLFMDLRQYDIMQNSGERNDYVYNMRHWSMLDDFDYMAQMEDSHPAPSPSHAPPRPSSPRPPPDLLTPEVVVEVTAPGEANEAPPPPPEALPV